MALQIVAVLKGKIQGLPQSDPTDVESDTTPATMGFLNVYVDSSDNLVGPGCGGFLTLEPIPEATLAALVDGACSIIISQGSGTVTQAVAN